MLTAADRERSIERIAALYRYEIHRGRSSAEMLEELLELVRQAVLGDESGDGDRIERRCTVVGELLLRALVDVGDADAAEGFVELSALERAQADALHRAQLAAAEIDQARCESRDPEDTNDTQDMARWMEAGRRLHDRDPRRADLWMRYIAAHCGAVELDHEERERLDLEVRTHAPELLRIFSTEAA